MFSKTLEVRKLMHINPRCILEEDSLASIDEIFKTSNFHHLPVMDEDGAVIGIVSDKDVKYATEQIAQRSSDSVLTRQIIMQWKVSRIMTQNPTILRDHETVAKAASYFLKNRFHALPILDENNKLVGILTSQDLLRFAYE